MANQTNPTNRPSLTFNQRVKKGVVNVEGIPKKIKGLGSWISHIGLFNLILTVYLLHRFSEKYLCHRVNSFVVCRIVSQNIDKAYNKVSALTSRNAKTISRINLMDLAMRNMMFKKSRAFITVGGMAIGIGSIVFLVSIGFGLQQLVVSKVARLEELRQADASLQPGHKEVINDETIAKVSQINGVETTLPVIATVARVTFNNSISDVAVYGVTNDFLKNSAIQPTRGRIYDSNEVATTTNMGKVAGVSRDVATEFSNEEATEFAINFNIPEGVWLKVRSQADKSAQVLGYTKRGIAEQQGMLEWGDWYTEAAGDATRQREWQGKVQGAWIRADVLLWEKTECDLVDPDCVDGTYQVLKDQSGTQQLAEDVYFAPIDIEFSNQKVIPAEPKVLGVSQELTETQLDSLILGTVDDVIDSATSAASLADVVSEDGRWVEISSESVATEGGKIESIGLANSAKKQAVVNTAMLDLMGLKEEEAIGKTFSTSFVVVNDLLDSTDKRMESIPADYEIVGVIPENKVPLFYVPFIDLRGLGISTYSQLKIIADNQKNLATIRKQIESLGLATRSVADTVKQIDQLFGAVRIVLTALGLIALSIAALGMFNTLTVSLLERTREVGLMKTMGMQSYEVQELFLTESMVMGFFGGILGILLGFGSAKLVGVLLTLYSISKGGGVIDIAYLPFLYFLFVILLSLIVGIFTGIYPAKRATKISALNALRYE